MAQTIILRQDEPLQIFGDLRLPNGSSIQMDAGPYFRIPRLGVTNISIGLSAGLTNGVSRQNSIGRDNVYIGDSSGLMNRSSGSIMIGHRAGYHVTGGNNVFIGRLAGYGNVRSSASNNIAIGTYTGVGLLSGVYNLFIGNGAGQSTVDGYDNVFVGHNAGLNNINGAGNIFIGKDAGPTSSHPDLRNSVAIGTGSQVAISNAIVLGTPTMNIGIGTPAPETKLHILTGIANRSGVRLGDLTSKSPAEAFNQTKFLSVDIQGNIILASTNSSGRENSLAELWKIGDDGLLQNSNNSGVIIGKGLSKIPTGYNLYVANGILTERIKVAIRNSSDWADYVFASKYRLPKLVDVERYIQTRRHLPGIPTADEVVREGLDLAEMDVRLLKKVEELTLYMIEMEKKLLKMEKIVIKLDQENKTLKKKIKKQTN